MSVAELSKLRMYEFHYDHYKQWYRDTDLRFTDTDSLMYHIYVASKVRILWNVRHSILNVRHSTRKIVECLYAHVLCLITYPLYLITYPTTINV
jgi:hypothetical protein